MASVMFPAPDHLPFDHLAGNNEVRLLYIIIIRFLVVYGVGILALSLPPAYTIKYDITVSTLHPRGPETRFKIIVIASRSSPDPWRWKISVKSKPSPSPPPSERTPKPSRFDGNARRRTADKINCSNRFHEGGCLLEIYFYSSACYIHRRRLIIQHRRRFCGNLYPRRLDRA